MRLGVVPAAVGPTVHLDDLPQGSDGVGVGPLLQDRLGQRIQLGTETQKQLMTSLFFINNSKEGKSGSVLKALYLYFDLNYCNHIICY